MAVLLSLGCLSLSFLDSVKTVKADNIIVEINSFVAEPQSGGRWNGNDYVWTADTSSAGHTFSFRLNFSLSGTYDFEPETVIITVPKSILRDKDGQPADTYDLSVPHESETNLPDSVLFTYHEEGDKIIITNCVTVPLGHAGYIDVGYTTTKRTFYYPDYGMPESEHINAKGASEPFKATINASLGDVSDSAESDPTPVYINTSAVLDKTEKRLPERYTTWQSSWGEEPADAYDYYYIVWEIRSFITNPTQMYDFTLVDNFNETDAEVVGYCLANSGSQEFTSQNTEYNCTESYEYGRYDYVLTRYKRSTYDAIIEAHDDELTTPGYSLTNKITATVDPVDQVDGDTVKTSTKTFAYEQPVFEHPTGSFYMWKWGLDYRGIRQEDSDDIRSFALGLLHDPLDQGGEESMGDLKFYTYVHGYPYPWTLGDANGDGKIDGADANMPEAYGMIPVDWELTDNKFSVGTIAEESSTDLQVMSAEDYELESLKLDFRIIDAEYDAEHGLYKEKDFDGDKDSVVVVVYAELNNSGEYIPIGTWKPLLSEFSSSAADLIDVFVGSTIYFKEGTNVTGYKLTNTNAFYYTRLGAYPSIKLKRSSLVTQFVEKAYDEGTRKIVVRNDASSAVYDHIRKVKAPTASNPNYYYYEYLDEPQELITFDRYGLDYAVGIVRDGHLEKNLTSYSNDKINRLFSVEWRIIAYEDFMDIDNRRKPVTQNSGVFYDLLPVAASYKDGSVEAYVDGEQINEGSFEVETVTNYNNTGRTLLIVRFNVPGDKYMFYYTSLFSWDDVTDVLKDDNTVINTVAYETGNENIGDGRPDDGGEVTYSDLMNDLDPDTNADKFLYTECKQDLTILTTGSLGLYKKVKSEKDDDYSYETTVNSDSDYSYKIRFATDSETRLTQLVIYDFLEAYKTKEGATSDWRGTLLYIDTSTMVNEGANPTIYYSEQDPTGVSIDDVSDVHSSFWVAAEGYGDDLSRVTAFAIDLGDFILDKGQSISCTVYMHAPATIDSTLVTPNAYNNVYLHKAYVSDGGEAFDPEIINQDFTIISYRMVGDLKIRKLDSSDHETPIQGCTFYLQGESFYGTEVSIKVDTNSDGIINFKDLERGSYILQEIISVDDYQINTHTWHVEIDENGVTWVDGVRVDEIYYLIEDDPRVHGDLLFYKRGVTDFYSTEPMIDGVVFKIEGESAYGNNIELTATSRNGVVEFHNIEMGTNYTLKEISAPDDWQVSDEVWYVTIDETGRASISGADSSSGVFTIYDEPYHKLTFKKLDEVNPSRTLEGAVFSLTGPFDEGVQTQVDLTATSDEFGTVEFTHLEAGTYILQEITPPEHYELDETRHVIVIHEDGTIEGLEDYAPYVPEGQQSDYVGYYALTNKRLYEGVLTITKVWDDNGDEDNRPIPVIHISTEDPVEDLPIATIDRNKWAEELLPFYNGMLTEATAFVHDDTGKTLEQIQAISGSVKIDDDTTTCSIYAWKEGDTVYWWSDAEIVYLAPDSSYMFYQAADLEALDLSDFKTSKTTNMMGMFWGCTALVSVDVSSFDTRKVTDMSHMFDDCTSLASLDLSNFNTFNVTKMVEMFENCKSMTDIDVTSFDTRKVTTTENMFHDCDSLTTLDVSSFNFPVVKTTAYMFFSLDNVESIIIGNWGGQQNENMRTMFCGNRKLKSLDLSSFNTSNVTQMQFLFQMDYALETLNISSFNTSKVTNFGCMFQSCKSLLSLNVSHFNTSNAQEMGSMFSGLSISELNLTGFDTSKVTSMRYMFNQTSNLTELDLSSFNTSKVENMYGMFEDMYKLKTIYVSDRWNTSRVTEHENMFWRDSQLVGGAGTTYAQVEVYDKTVAHWQVGGLLTYKEYVAPTNGNGLNGITVETPDTVESSVSAKEAGRNDRDRDSVDVYIFESTTNSTMYDGDDPDNAYDCWIDNGDGTWTYRFHIFDEDAEYYIWESECTGYWWLEDELNAIILEYLQGMQDANVTIVNHKDNSEDGKLIIYKQLEGDYTDEDLGKEFTFTVTVAGIEDGTYGDMEFSGGTATVTIKANESVSAEGLPLGSAYSVVEIGDPLFAASYENAEGTIEDTNLIKIYVTNHKQVGSLSITKVVQDDEQCEDTFTFTVTLTGDLIEGTQVFGDYAFTDGVATINVKAGETVTIPGIPTGTEYTVTEVERDGYEHLENLDVNVSGVIVTDETIAVSFTNKPVDEIFGKFTLVKKVVGRQTDEKFSFQIVLEGLKPNTEYTFNGETYTSNGTGNLVIDLELGDGDSVVFDNLPIGTKYTITEAASGYKASYEVTDSAGLDLIVSPSGSNTTTNSELAIRTESVDEGEDVTVTFTNTTQLYKISFAKFDDKGDFLPGAEFQILDENGTVLYEFTSPSDGMVQYELAAGTYTLHEVSAPDGYIAADDVAFTIDEEGSITVEGGKVSFIEVVNPPTNVQILKVDEDGNPLEGATMAVYLATSESGTEYTGDPVYSYISKASAEDVTGILLPGTRYVLVELRAPEGYEVADPVAFTTANDDTLIQVTMTDVMKTYEIPFLKVDKDGQPVEGALLQIKQGDEVLYEWTTTAEPKVFELKPGDYTLHEEQAPEGYKTAEDIDFTVGLDGTITKGNTVIEQVEMVDILKDYTVPVIKVDEEGNPVPGAVLEIYVFGEDEPLMTITSGTEPVYVTLNPGDYVLHEAEAPVGYELAEDVYFTVEMNSDVTVDGEDVVSVKMTDVLKHYEVPFLKVDDKGKPLAGAVLQVLSEDGEVVAEFTSGTEPTVLQLTPGNYYLHEAATPDDDAYFPADDVYFTVNMDGTISIDDDTVELVSMTDDGKYKMVLSKKVENYDETVEEKYFTFTIVINGKPEAVYTVDLSKASANVEGNGNPSAFAADETGRAEVTVYLYDGESITINGLAKGAEFNVTVTEEGAETYDTTNKDNFTGKTRKSKTFTTTLEDLDEEGLIVQFVNDHGTPPTGEYGSLKLYGFCTVYAMIAMILYMMLSRKREEVQ